MGKRIVEFGFRELSRTGSLPAVMRKTKVLTVSWNG